MPNVIPTVETPVTRQYVGARYVPVFDGAWDNTKDYAPLTIVSYQGNSYTSRTFVPAGTDISNETYWALTGNYNAQVEAYRQEVLNYKDVVDAIKYFVTPQEYGAKGDGIADDTTSIQSALDSGYDVIIPDGNYKITRTLEATKNCNIICYGTIHVAGDFDGIIIGNDEPQENDSGWFIGKTILLNVKKDTLNWSAYTGVTLENVWRANITILTANFKTGIKLYGNEYGCAWNVLSGCSCFNCFNGIELVKTTNGWVNQNTFIGGSIAWSMSVVRENTTTSAPVNGLIIVGNENSFYNTAIDGGGSSSDDYDYFNGFSINGNWNHLDNLRLERVSTISATGNWNTLDNPYMFTYTTVTSNYIALQIKSNKVHEVCTEGSQVLKLTAAHTADLIAGYNNIGTLVHQVKSDGDVMSLGKMLLNYGTAEIASTTNSVDSASSDLPSTSIYVKKCNDGTAGAGILFGYKHNADNESQLLVSLYHVRYRKKSSGTWDAWVNLDE